MHKDNNNKDSDLSINNPSDLVHFSMIESIDSICDDPFGLSIEKRKPKKYPYLWVVKFDRPLLLIKDIYTPIIYDRETPRLGYIQLFTQTELAEKSKKEFCRPRRYCPKVNIAIRSISFVEALALARNLPTPFELLRDVGTCVGLQGVFIQGARTSKYYPL